MQVKLNGKMHIIRDNQTLAELIVTLKLNNKKNIAIAVNKKVIPSYQWEIYTLSEADNIDVVQAIGGG